MGRQDVRFLGVDRSDLLTWQGLRNLATCEVFNVAQGIAIVPPKPKRAPLVLEARGMKDGRPMPWMQLPQQVKPEPGAIVYARAAWRPPWRGEIARIGVPCVVVSAFHDRMIKANACEEMFSPGFVKAWFGVQTATRHPRLVSMPIGVDGRRLPSLKAAPIAAEKDILLYVNFKLIHQWQRTVSIRKPLWHHFTQQPWATCEKWDFGGDAHYYAQLGRSKFVLSPPGFAWDCYRTYEAIAMGAIPIVKRNPPLTDVCESLPILMVGEWEEITQEFLEQAWLEQAEKDCRTMTMSYWRKRILDEQEEIQRQV